MINHSRTCIPMCNRTSHFHKSFAKMSSRKTWCYVLTKHCSFNIGMNDVKVQEERPETLAYLGWDPEELARRNCHISPPEKQCIKSICDINNWLDLSLINLPGPEKFRLMTNRNLQWNIHCPHLSQLYKFFRSFFLLRMSGYKTPAFKQRLLPIMMRT